MTRWRRALGAVAGLATLPASLAAGARFADRRLNAIEGGPLTVPTEVAQRLHTRLRVADLHADALLWPRDLARRHRRGHVDLPRLLAGNVGLQVFSVVTRAPPSRDLDRGIDADAFDPVTLLSIASGRPVATWHSRLARALEQAARLHDLARRSHGRLRVVTEAGDLSAPPGVSGPPDLAGPPGLAGVLAVEGLHAIEGDPDNVDVLFDTGFRLFGPVHLADNDLGGSSTGTSGQGLTSLGREALGRVERRGGIIDLAHASPSLFDDVLAMATRPVMVSHTGVRATHDTARNLSDAQVAGIAGAGGLVGIGLWPHAVGAADPRASARAIAHVAGLVGVDHVALGSDFDGAVPTPFDAAGWVHLVDALLAEGLTEEQVELVMSGNALLFLSTHLPDPAPV